MNKEARNTYPQFASDWRDLGYFDPPQPPNLTNKVHPIFEKFRVEKKTRAFHGTDEEYDKILPALQLATNYLYSPKSRAFIYSLDYADREKVIEPDTGRECTQFRLVDQSLYSNEKMDRIWEQVALHTTFGPLEKSQLSAVRESWLGCAQSFFKDGADLKGDGLRGLATDIGFRREYLDDINNLCSSRRARSREMLFVQFSLAMVLCHEVAHVVEKARDWECRLNMIHARRLKELDPQRAPEPFYEDQTIAELGFAYENEILGGRPRHCILGHPENAQFITDWPDGEYKYGATRTYPYRGPPVKVSIESFVISMKYIQKVFRQEFWDTFCMAVSANPEARQLLMIPMTVGHVIERYTMEEFLRWPKEDRLEWFKRQQRRITRDPPLDPSN